MSLKDELFVQLKDAMKSKDVTKKNVITMLRSDIKKVEIDEKKECSDDEIFQIIQNQIKTKKKAIEDFKAGDREDLVKEAEREIEILTEYLPSQLSDQELNEAVGRIIDELGATSIKEMGKVISKAKNELSNRVDMGRLSAAIRGRLQ